MDNEILKFKLAVESSGEAIFMTDVEGVFTYVNPEFTKLYGYKSDEVVNKVTPRILKSGLKTADFYKDFWGKLNAGIVVKTEMNNKSKNGNIIIIEATVNPILDQNKKMLGFLAVQHDVTARKKTEVESDKAKIELQQKIKDLESFNRVTVNRELKMVELKDKIKELEAQLKVSL